jgi:hypothetical protein
MEPEPKDPTDPPDAPVIIPETPLRPPGKAKFGKLDAECASTLSGNKGSSSPPDKNADHKWLFMPGKIIAQFPSCLVGVSVISEM